MQKETRVSNSVIAKWFLPYVLVQTFQYQFTKDGLTYASPFVLMAIRYVGIGVTFYYAGGRKFALDRDSILIAAFASVSTILWSFGLQIVSPGDSAVLSYTMPLFSIPIAFLVIKEAISTRELFGALIGFSGVVLYSTTLTHGFLLLGAFYTILNAVFWATFSVYYRKLRVRDPLPMFTTQFLLGSIPMIVGSFFLPELHPSASLLFDVVYIILLSGVVQFYLWNGLLRRARVGRITTLAFAVPALTILLDSIRSLSFPSPLAVLGGTVMFVGILISSWRKNG